MQLYIQVFEYSIQSFAALRHDHPDYLGRFQDLMQEKNKCDAVRFIMYRTHFILILACNGIILPEVSAITIQVPSLQGG